MENEMREFIESKSLKPIETIDKIISSAKFINNEEIACIIQEKFHIFNIPHNKLSEPITNFSYTGLTINNKNNEVLVFNSNFYNNKRGRAALYNPIHKTRIITFKIPPCIQCELSTKENTILLINKEYLAEYNYQNNTPLSNQKYFYSTATDLIVNQAVPVIGAINYKEAHIYRSSLTEERLTIPIPNDYHHTIIRTISSNNLLAVLNCHTNTLSLINLNNKQSHVLKNEDDNSRSISIGMYKMCFNPSGSVLLTLSKQKNLTTTIQLLEYWDTETFTKIHTEQFNNAYCSHIMFSPDGKLLAAGFIDNLLIYRVPFNIQYQPETKTKIHFMLYTLHNVKSKDDTILPHDIINIIAHMYLTLCKR